ncbi:integrase arm-type DNA-binding domain-containing protein [Candidatus Pelagibacter ubique]|nr:integrase arm-type DNA-binding domain-containing protein [Candidatus Pelagibacter ubique]MDB3960331.1 integrase arm-type DNA-binding domain-containing protein [Candidatus Pelagibacter sp.]
MKLTDAFIKNINHQDRDQFFSMQGTEGLTLVVYKYPSKSKTWFYQYRPRGKNPVRLKVGTYEELGITKAVSRAKKISNEIFSGKDPYAARQSFKGENTLGEQIKESYNTVFTATRYRPSTITAIKNIFGIYIFRRTLNTNIREVFNQLDNIQHIKISSITNNQIVKFHQILGARTPRLANMFVEYLRMVFNIWISRGITNNQPCLIKKEDKFEEKEYLDFLREDELDRVRSIIINKDLKTGRFLESHYKKYKLSVVACALIAYQIFSSRRTRSEASPMQWSMINDGLVPTLKLIRTKTSKKNQKTDFGMGEDELDVIRTIKKDRLNNPKSKFYYPPEDPRFDFVFPSAAYGRDLGHGRKAKSLFLTDVDKTWKKVLLLAGIKRNLKHYATRHTHATQLLRATGNLKLVADTLGITIKQASKYAKTQHEDVIEGKNKAFKQKVKEPLKNILYL